MNRQSFHGSRRVSTLFVLRGMTLLVVALATRLLTEVAAPAVFGQFKLTIGVALLGVGILTRPLVQYAMRTLHDAENQGLRAQFLDTARRSLALLQALGAITITTASIVVSWLTPLDWTVGLGLAAAMYMAAQSLVDLERGVLVSDGKVLIGATVDASMAALLPAGAALAVGVMSLNAAGMVGAQAAILVIALGTLRRLNGTVSGSEGDRLKWLRASLHFTVPLSYVGFASWVFNLGDRYVLELFSTTEQVGLYSAAYGLAAAPITTVGGLLPTLTYEPLFRAAARNDSIERRSIVRSMLLWQTVLVALAVCAVWLAAPLASGLLLAEGYRDGAVPLIRLVSLGQAFQVIGYALDLDTYSISRTGRIAIAYSAAALSSMAVSIVLVPSIGATGAAVGTVVGGLLYLVTMLVLAYGRVVWGRVDRRSIREN